MNPVFWNQRYGEHDTVYGQEPNAFFRQFIDRQKAGSLLLPAEGEGRNAVYAARKGWDVYAFDFSEVAKQKALSLAVEQKVAIHYDLLSVESFKASKQYDVAALVYVHLPPQLREAFHLQVVASLKPGGFLVLEAFSKQQLELESGGPRDEALLYDAPSLCKDFSGLHIISCGQKEIELNEGDFHKGKANVLRLVAQKI